MESVYFASYAYVTLNSYQGKSKKRPIDISICTDDLKDFSILRDGKHQVRIKRYVGVEVGSIPTDKYKERVFSGRYYQSTDISVIYF